MYEKEMVELIVNVGEYLKMIDLIREMQADLTSYELTHEKMLKKLHVDEEV